MTNCAWIMVLWLIVILVIMVYPKRTVLFGIFMKIIHEFYCGVNGHNQNGVSERIIFMVSEMAHAMMIHLSIF